MKAARLKKMIAKAREIKRLKDLAREKGNSEVEVETPTPVPKTPTTLSLKDRLALIKKNNLAKVESKVDTAGSRVEKPTVPAIPTTATTATVPTTLNTKSLSILPEPQNTHVGIDGSVITYNKKQQDFVEYLATGNPCVLIGAAGTGKTTCTQGAIQNLIQSGKVPLLNSDGHKYLKHGAPGIVTISYTRRAVNNIRKVLPEDLKGNCITAHKLLEYAPEYYEVIDPVTGYDKRTMAFVPTRNKENPLPSTIHTIIVEESSMVDLKIFSEIIEALTHKVQWVFIGDIQQLPPVFGSAILGYGMLALKVIELTEVYRQALESPIIKLAHRILSGKPIPVAKYDSWKVKGKLTLHPWKKKLSADNAVATLGAFFCKAYDNNAYDVDNDIILIPYNKACGTLELNRYIANHIARKHHKLTYEVRAGFNKHYFSEGDKVLYDKEDAEIVDISTNLTYSGARVQPESKTLDYWGHNPNLAQETFSTSSEMDIDMILEQVASESEDRVTQASHIILIRLLDTGDMVRLSKAAEINNLLHSYALTVHKAQGSEWRKVFLCLHQTHSTMLQRELLYTGSTRAREELYVICEPESFTKGIISQKIKGNTLEEKAKYFQGKLDSKDNSYLAKINFNSI